ncbi:MAG: hypothetical protein DRP81_05050 [Candidatus Omnitrophota bacterium]|nr:MAG: hypothetical protein DRP81_05050 [Candidatus Omnitrophota bacterium]
MKEEKIPPFSKKKSAFSEVTSLIKDFFTFTSSTIGIDIGEGYIKIVQFQKTRKGYTINDYRIRAIPFKVKDNQREKEKFIKEFIAEFISQSRIKTSLGRIAIRGSGIFIFSLLMPLLPEKDLRGAIGIELKKRLPYQIDFANVHFDYIITERLVGETSQVFVTCIAVDNKVLDKYLGFLKGFGLRPEVINADADALGSLVEFIGEGQYVGVLDMGARDSCLNFYKKGTLQFAREIPIGGEHITEGILKAIASLGGNPSFEDAENFKRHCGIPMREEAYIDFYTDFGALKGNQITTAVRPSLERLITEVSRTVNFYIRAYKLEQLDILYITGGASRTRNIDKILSTNLKNLPIKRIDKLEPLKVVKSWFVTDVFRHELGIEEAVSHLAVAFGLCLHKGGKINIIPPREKMEQKALFLMFLTRTVFPFILFLTLGFYAFFYGKYLLYKIIIARLQGQAQKIAPITKEIESYLSVKKIYEERESLLKKAIGEQPLWWGILKELSNITPKEIVLYSLEIKPTSYSTKTLTITGEAIAKVTNLDLVIAEFTLNLNGSPFFRKANLVSTERDVSSSLPRAKFKITCELVY